MITKEKIKLDNYTNIIIRLGVYQDKFGQSLLPIKGEIYRQDGVVFKRSTYMALILPLVINKNIAAVYIG